MHRMIATLALAATTACYGNTAKPAPINDPATSPTVGTCTQAWCISDVLTAGPTGPNAAHDVQRVFATGGFAWAADSFGNVAKHDGTGWTIDSALVWYGASGVWGTSPSDVWVVGDTVQHWDGAAWTPSKTDPLAFGTALEAVWGASANDVWIGGGGGHLEHWDGTAWTSFGFSQASDALAFNYDIFSIWGSASSDVWIVGDVGFTHWDGVALSATTQPLSQIAEAVWGTSATDVWAVGQFGVIGHWDGTSWTEQQSPTTEDLAAVWGSGAGDVWAVGKAGTVVHWDGLGWGLSPSGTDRSLNGVWGTGPDDVWAGGGDVIIHHGQN